MHVTHTEIDHWLLEDAPGHDETVHALDLPDQPGTLSYTPRQQGVVAGVQACAALARALGLQAQVLAGDGDAVGPGDTVLRLSGGAHALHLAWKQGMNLLEHLSGVATATASLVCLAQRAAPGVQVAATRKALPGARRWLQHAVRCGGGLVHRAGLSETVLVFEQHRVFLPGLGWPALVTLARSRSPEKKIAVEVATPEQALAAAQAGADTLQLDKFTPDALQPLVPRLRALAPGAVLAAAGGIHAGNVAAYAATGVDVLVTSSLYHAPPLDFAARMAAA